MAFQDYSNSAIDLSAYFKNTRNMQWNVRFGGFQENYKKYGFEPKTLNLPGDSLEVKFMTWRGRLGFHNINRTEFGLSYAPEAKIDLFNDDLKNSEGNTYINLPLQKSIGENLPWTWGSLPVFPGTRKIVKRPLPIISFLLRPPVYLNNPM